TLVDTLPPGFTASGTSWTFVSGSATGGATVNSPTSGAGALNTTVNLPSGSSLTFTQTVHFASAATGNQTNSVTVTPPPGTTDTTPGNNTATDTDTAARASISGCVYLDLNNNGVREAGDIPLA